MMASSDESMAYLSYLSDRPVGITNDLLWEKATIRRQIENIAQRITSPLYADTTRLNEQLSDSMTFAIYGRWGMGKSSALRMLKEAAQDIIATGDEKIESTQIKICEYVASAYEPFAMDARITLAQRIFTALAGGDSEAIQEWSDQAYAFGGHAFPSKEEANPTAKSGRAYILEQMATTLPRLIDFDKIIQDKMREPDGKPCVLLILIDDLDRCTTTFIWQILNFIQQLSEVRNLFFVLAVEQELLKTTIKKHSFGGDGGGYREREARQMYSAVDSDKTHIDPDFALEKYIQHSITVPDMSDDGLKYFVAKLMEDSKARDDSIGKVARVIIDNVQFLQYGLRAMKGERVLTPRSVKRCLNTISLDLQERLKIANTSIEQQKVLKERILEFVWLSFYKNYFLPANTQDAQKNKQPMFAELEDACARFAKDTSGASGARLEFDLKSISSKYGPFWNTKLDLIDEVPHSLARYLGILPHWFLKTDDEEQFTREDLGYEDKFQNLYIRSETAESAGNRRESLVAAQQILNLIQDNRKGFNQRHAPMVGNIAINAERFGVTDLAEKLYELALDLDPNHSHNIQNYVDFIIKAKLDHLYPRARTLLALLNEKHARYRPDRTLALEAQLYTLTNEESSASEHVDSKTVDKVVEEFLKDPSSRQTYVSVLSLLDAIGDFEAMRKVAKAYYSKATSESDRYLAIRSLGDMLAASPDELHEREAMDMYRYLLENYKSIESRPDLPDMQHNYGTLLYKHDYDDLAGEMWFKAYERKPNNMGIRRAYSLYLLRANRPDLASIVTEGKTVPVKVTQPALKVLPKRFLDGEYDRWWEDSAMLAE